MGQKDDCPFDPDDVPEALRHGVFRRQVPHGLQLRHTAVALHEQVVFRLIVETCLAGRERLGGFDHEGAGLVEVGQARGAGGAAWHGRLRGDGNANDRRVGAGAGLHDGVQVIQAVAIGRDIER